MSVVTEALRTLPDAWLRPVCMLLTVGLGSLGFFVFATIQPAIASNSMKLDSVSQFQVDQKAINITQQEHSRALARVEGQLALIIENQLKAQ